MKIRAKESIHPDLIVLLWGGKSQAKIIQEMITVRNLGKVAVVFDKSITVAQFQTNARVIN